MTAIYDNFLWKNEKSATKSIRMFQDQIKQMRAKINSHLDTLELNILQKLDNTEDKIKSKTDILLTQLSRISNNQCRCF
jgi:hypothetical protein